MRKKFLLLCVFVRIKTIKKNNIVPTNELAKHLNELSDNLLFPTRHVNNMECLELFSLPPFRVCQNRAIKGLKKKMFVYLCV